MLCWLLAATAVAAEPHRHDSGPDWLVFLSGAGVHRSGISGTPLDRDDGVLSADVLLTHSFGRARLLAETVLATDDTEVERLQLGWQLGQDTFAWIGRVHQPSSAWNTEHHHGQYLQTAITRPAIELWEDEGGLLPQHLVGALLETRRPLADNAALKIDVTVGGGPRVERDELQPYRILHANTSGHQLSWAARLAWLPDFAGPDAVGLLAGHHELPVDPAAAAALRGARHLDADVLGAYADWQTARWRLIATLYHIGIEYEADAELGDDSVWAGYLQFEYRLDVPLTAFARHENSANASRSSYFAREPGDFALRRTALGLRWDLARRQALTIELARSTDFLRRYDEVRLQWSSVLP